MGRMTSPRMCHASALGFVEAFVRVDDVKGKDVLEVGSYDVNGSRRAIILKHDPRSSLGVDLRPGPGGVCIVTTRSPGCPPYDDPAVPGVFAKVVKP